jgi:hypothetical protein
MKRAIALTTLVIVLATVFVLGITPRAQAGEPDLSLKSVGRPSTGEVVLTAPRR